MLGSQFKVTLVDRKDYFEHTTINLKCCVDKSHIDNVLFSYASILKAYNHMFGYIQGTLETVNLNNTIKIKKPNGHMQIVKFDILILCTGFSYIRPVKDEEALSLAARKQSLEAFY